ncbi:MAG: hypothetical protein KAU62_00530 [Candidatus Heimdallarchaeota archaeon]|nr:hypothetical protein [Candidatus Heimdallarchaeota archaeon]MCK4609617.1 hypothetical protein [Candidatus Heimdallarchaeota archaeon]
MFSYSFHGLLTKEEKEILVLFILQKIYKFETSSIIQGELMTKQNIIIIGAGLGGLSTGIYAQMNARYETWLNLPEGV